MLSQDLSNLNSDNNFKYKVGRTLALGNIRTVLATIKTVAQLIEISD